MKENTYTLLRIARALNAMLSGLCFIEKQKFLTLAAYQNHYGDFWKKYPYLGPTQIHVCKQDLQLISNTFLLSLVKTLNY